MGRTRRRISFEERQWIEELMTIRKDSDLGIDDIAATIGVSRAAIFQELSRCKGEYNAEEAEKAIVCRPFSLEERIKIEKFLKEGCSLREIGRRLGKAEYRARREVKANPTPYNAYRAEMRSLLKTRKNEEVI